MSYYQLISLKLQMGIDPDASIDLESLLKMWKQHQLSDAGVTPTVPVRGRRPAGSEKVHHIHQA